MRIGLVRHFPVAQALPSGWMTAAQLHRWRQEYEAAEILVGPAAVDGSVWKRCLCSDIRRAFLTAQTVYKGEITPTPLLREVEVLQFATGRLSLPVWLWLWALRIAWMTAHKSQRPARDDFKRRVRAIADELDAGQADTLVVSHAAMMIYLRRELIRRGYAGPKFNLAEHARLYVFERAAKAI